MTAIDQSYRCNMCGNVVRVLEAGEGELICCGEPMTLALEKAGLESEISEKEEPMKIEPEMGPEADMEPETEPEMETEPKAEMKAEPEMEAGTTEIDEEPDSEIKIKGSAETE